MFNESNIGGHDYLRNLVHVPFFLQNAGLRKVKAAQQAALMSKNPSSGRTMMTSNSNHAAVLNWLESEDTANNQPAVDRTAPLPQVIFTQSVIILLFHFYHLFALYSHFSLISYRHDECRLNLRPHKAKDYTGVIK